jgi:hypothetical protein
VDDLAAERWDLALDNEAWICSTWPDGKPQRQRPDQVIKVIDNEPAQAVGRDRFPGFVFGKYPKVVVSKFYVPRVERLVQVIVAMVAANQPIRIEVISEVQEYAIPFKNSLKSGLSRFDYFRLICIQSKHDDPRWGSYGHHSLSEYRQVSW